MARERSRSRSPPERAATVARPTPVYPDLQDASLRRRSTPHKTLEQAMQVARGKREALSVQVDEELEAKLARLHEELQRARQHAEAEVARCASLDARLVGALTENEVRWKHVPCCRLPLTPTPHCHRCSGARTRSKAPE